MPDPTPTLNEQTKTHCDAIARSAGLHTEEVVETESAETAALIRRYGKNIDDLADDTVDMIEGCAAPFSGLPDHARRIRDDAAELGRLTDSKDQVDTLSGRLDQRIKARRGRLANNIDMAVRTRDATLANPSVSSEVKAGLSTSSRRIDRRLEERNAKIVGRRFATLALKEDMGKRLLDSTGEASDKDLRISALELENQYLSGERLRPSDVVLSTPAAPKVARRRGPAKEGDTPPARSPRRTPR